MLLLSIKPKFAQAIYAGVKTYEFRRIAPRQAVLGLALIYESAPIGRVTGVARISDVILLNAGEAERICGERDPFAEFYESYLSGAKSPCALEIDTAERFIFPVLLGEICSLKRPPQSFAYVYVDPEALTDRLRPEACHSIASGFAVE